jgi:hypothetical protein
MFIPGWQHGIISSEPADPEPISMFIAGYANTTGNFAGVSFGTPRADRYIVVGVSAVERLANPKNISGVTINGSAATIVINSGGTFHESALAIAAVPGGSTGSIVVTTTGFNRFVIGVYRLVGLVSAVPHDTGFNATTSGEVGVDLDIPAGGVGLGAASFWGTTALAPWVGLTSNYDVSPGSLARGSTAEYISVAGGVEHVDIAVHNSGADFVAASFV